MYRNLILKHPTMGCPCSIPGVISGDMFGNFPPVYLQLLDLSSMLVACIQLAQDQTRHQELPLLYTIAVLVIKISYTEAQQRYICSYSAPNACLL